MLPSGTPLSMQRGDEQCKCEHDLGHTCNVCRSDLILLLVKVGVPLRTARRFVRSEVGIPEAVA